MKPDATIKKYLIDQNEGTCQVSRSRKFTPSRNMSGSCGLLVAISIEVLYNDRMILYVDETENDEYFIVTGMLVDSREDIVSVYNRFKKRIEGIKISDKKRRGCLQNSNLHFLIVISVGSRC